MSNSNQIQKSPIPTSVTQCPDLLGCSVNVHGNGKEIASGYDEALENARIACNEWKEANALDCVEAEAAAKLLCSTGDACDFRKTHLSEHTSCSFLCAEREGWYWTCRWGGNKEMYQAYTCRPSWVNGYGSGTHGIGEGTETPEDV